MKTKNSEGTEKRKKKLSVETFIYLLIWLRLTRIQSLYMNTQKLLGRETTTA